MQRNDPEQSTLLDLLARVNADTATEAEALERVVDLVNSGRVMLCGNFRGQRFSPSEVLAHA